MSTVRDGGVVAWRNLLNVRRTPGSLVTAIVQPVIFVLLLAYVFGGSLGGDSYREFLVAGIFVQTLTFSASLTAIGLANDLQKGLIDRYRSLPMSRMAVILGRTTSDLAVSALSVAVIVACGLVIGWRINGGLADAVAGFLLLFLFAFAVSWIGAVIGLTARSVEVAQSLGLIWLFPVTFVSGAFVSIAAMPAPLRTVAEWNPVTAVATAVRGLFDNPAPEGLAPPAGWPADNAALYAVLSSVAIIAVFAPVALAQYRRINRR
ncbi:ABC transporter permease [Nocardiopsis sp. HUAS JQ3]|uniref:ABC transporter permease n=1 Tax=Nocardiopsis sp. HUAS JQ3 TaxID=3061629 RepID=UPI0023A9DE75|nr:ABC transporter permease [Nocardiopsis sp. HUAS JQ3]WDZ90310.1 ABC transporter permease [Nocardiopsis sp. HUAS JQ3]